jgi:hypothetical protein
MTGRGDQGRERGAVLVMVAIWLPVLALFVSLAIDFGHFFDYSRNLQNRADAAALAAGTQYGGVCFGTPSQAELDNIGETAQQYAGPLSGADLPYNATQMGGRSSYNVPNLKAGAAAKLHVLLNSTQSWDHGGANFSLGTFCDASENGSSIGPVADVKITQDHLPLFLPLVGFQPNINAHARVQLQEAASESNTSPIAVGDPAQTPCVIGRILDQSTGTVISTVTMSKVSGSTPPTFAGTTPSPISPTSCRCRPFSPTTAPTPREAGRCTTRRVRAGVSPSSTPTSRCPPRRLRPVRTSAACFSLPLAVTIPPRARGRQPPREGPTSSGS